MFRHPLVRRAVYESAPRRLAAGGPRAARPRRSRRAAPRPPSARTTSSSRRRRATRTRSRCCSTPARPTRRARAGRRGALVRGGAAAAARAATRARQVDVRVALASALRSLGELERCRATLLEAIELLPADDAAQRVELTALCAAVEHWLGRHEDAHRRLTRAWEELPDRSTAAAAALQIELAVDGLYELDFDQTRRVGRGRARRPRAPVGDRRADRRGRRGALPRRDRGRAASRTARAHRARGAALRRRGSPTPSWRRGWRRSTTWAGPRTTSSTTTRPSPTSTAGSRSPAPPARGGCWCR